MIQKSQSWDYIQRKLWRVFYKTIHMHRKLWLLQKDTRTLVFTAALFTTAKTWKQPKCPPTETWIKMGRIYTMEHYSATKKNKTMASAATQCNHRTERSKSETERQTPYELTYTWV